MNHLITLALLLVSSLANAQTLTCNKRTCTVHQTTADRLIVERGLVCLLASKPARFVSLPNGTTAVVQQKVCK